MTDQPFEDYLQSLLDEIKNCKRVKATDIPNIELYMDQVTTFMDDHLGLFKRTDEDKVLTKTMINNYSKYDLLPPTIRKKYTNEHIILMLFIYYMKPILSITDIKELLDPLRTLFLDKAAPQDKVKSATPSKKKDKLDLRSVHDRIIESEIANFPVFEKRMQETMSIAGSLFDDVEDEKKRELLSIFATSYFFTIQASAQKHMITSLIDQYLNKEKAE